MNPVCKPIEAALPLADAARIAQNPSMESAGPARSATEQLALSAAAALQAGFAELRHTPSTGSTNEDLVREARRGRRSPAVLVADHQTAGRGRLGRRWSDAAHGHHGGEASLLVSFRLPASAAGAPDRAAAVSAAALSAVSGALAGTGATVGAKWPNDLVVESPGVSGKLAGVLSEFVEGDPPVVVVGLGLNVAEAPGEPGAVSLARAGGGATRDELLASLLEELPGYLADPSRARADLRSASATLGREVRVLRTDGTSFTGTAVDIDGAGRLVVAGERGEMLVDAGDLFHLTGAR